MTIEQLALKDYEQMGGPDFISSREDHYFDKERQEAFRAALLRLREENALIPVSYLKK